ncbi:MAG: sigma-70 family RNA polymerase sigma factor [Pirellulaceae bacterium]|nr:RNA polymerase subunit sigma-24 [Planctomycetaceae bacterium]MDP6557907.1 sigma-70 family RNA polymerase sigma factor [Pirellulaceae bacterium]
MSHSDSRDARDDNFDTTHWSLVLLAGADTSRSAQAMAALCEAYWYPLYAFIRRRGSSPADAEDLTQAFFATLLEKGTLESADPQRGRFRAFLLTSVKYFLSNQRAHAGAQKRGGGTQLLSLDFRDAEGRYLAEPADSMTAERFYQRRWALTLLDRVLAQLEKEYTASGREETFTALQDLLARKRGSTPYREIASDLEMTEGAVKTAVHRMRRRYRSLLELEISHTLADTEDTQDELRELLRAIGDHT